MNPKEKFLDRMEQTFGMLIRQKELLIGSAIINGGFSIATVALWKLFLSLVVFDAFFTHSSNYTVVIVGLIVGLALLFIQIGIFLGFIKYISSLCAGLQTDLKSSMIYGMQRIWESCYTYYYVFLYTLLIPALFFIGGLLLVLLDLMQGRISLAEGLHGAQYANIGLIFFGILSCLTLYFVIYRGFKSYFAIYMAVDYENYTEKSFQDSIKVTDNQWVRIFGNLIGVAVMISLVMSIFSGILSIGGSSLNTSALLAIKESDAIDIKSILQNFTAFGVGMVISSALSGIGGVFSIAFTYIFFKRLELEATEGISREFLFEQI